MRTIPIVIKTAAIRKRRNLQDIKHSATKPKNKSTAANTHRPSPFLRLIVSPLGKLIGIYILFVL